MKTKTLTVKIRLATYKKLRRMFKAERGESVASYFERLAQEIENGGNVY